MADKTFAGMLAQQMTQSVAEKYEEWFEAEMVKVPAGLKDESQFKELREILHTFGLVAYAQGALVAAEEVKEMLKTFL